MADTKLNEKYRLLLLQKQSALHDVKATGDGAANVVELDQTKVGRLSRMDALQAQAMSVETNRRREIEIQRIESALQRLQKNDYGFCLRCGEDIAEGRLEVDPAATICFDCASDD
jgi:DnaK suppressor protein